MANVMPDDIIFDIVKRVGESDFRGLVGFIFAGLKTMKIATSDAVLRATNIEAFKRRASWVNGGSTYQTFFKRCVDAKNNTAIILEGLRLAFHKGDLVGGIRLIEISNELGNFGAYSLGMLKICIGDYKRGMEILERLGLEFLGVKEADEVGLDVHEAVGKMMPRWRGSFYKTYYFPQPECGCESTGLYCQPQCNYCFVHWHSSELCKMS